MVILDKYNYDLYDDEEFSSFESKGYENMGSTPRTVSFFNEAVEIKNIENQKNETRFNGIFNFENCVVNINNMVNCRSDGGYIEFNNCKINILNSEMAFGEHGKGKIIINKNCTIDGYFKKGRGLIIIG